MKGIISYLESRNIEFSTHGKNTSPGWVNIQCIFPGCSDHSNHLGINIRTLILHCWKCGKSGGIDYLLRKIENSFNIDHIIKEFDLIGERLRRKEVGDLSISSSISQPKGLQSFPEKYHKTYLKKRRFNRILIERDYGILYSNKGFFERRIVAPIIIGGKIVNYIGRDATNTRKRKYKMLPDNKAGIPRAYTVYNIDSVYSGGNCLIVEGFFDVLRVGHSTVGTLSTVFSLGQVKEILKRKPGKVFVCYDSEDEAQERAEKLVWTFSKFVRTYKVILNIGDPSSQALKSIVQLRKEIFK